MRGKSRALRIPTARLAGGREGGNEEKVDAAMDYKNEEWI